MVTISEDIHEHVMSSGPQLIVPSIYTPTRYEHTTYLYWDFGFVNGTRA